MEWLVLIAVVLAWIYVPRLVGSLSRAGWRAATGKGSFASNFEASFVGMKPLQIRLREERVEGERHAFSIYRLEIKGLFPVRVSTNVAVSASIFDVTEKDAEGSDKLQPVLCFLDQYQEPDSICYQDVTRIGAVEPDSGFVDWQTVANVIPETLTGPRSGQRRLRVFLSVFDLADPPRFQRGFRDGPVLGTYVSDFEWNLESTGYREVSEKREKAEELTIQAAVAIALADGSLANPEGQVMQRWLSRRLEMLEGDRREERRETLNATMKQAFMAGRQRQLSLDAILAELAQIGDAAGKIDAVELCLDVMSADGHADQSELKAINRMAQVLGVELERFHEMKDKRLSGLSASIQHATDYYALLGMEHGWDQGRIRSHLNKLYSQWNSRAESLEDPEKRAQAERMLETIAAARKALLG